MRYILAMLVIVAQAFGSISVGNGSVASPIAPSSIKRVSLRQPVVVKPNASSSRRTVLAQRIAACQAWGAMRTVRTGMTNNGVNGGLRPN